MLIFHGEVARLSGGKEENWTGRFVKVAALRGIVTVTEFQKISNYVTRRRGVALKIEPMTSSQSKADEIGT